MRIRTVKPEFFTHEGIFEAEQSSGLPLRLAFIGLWCAADREGRFRWQPRRLGIQILPYDDLDFSRVLDALTTRGFLVKYRVKGASFGCIPSFIRHQVINNKESDSVLPDPNEETSENISNQAENDASATREARVDHATATPLFLDQGEGKGREGKGKEGNAASPWHVALGLEMPEALRTEPCMEAARLWLKYKSERREGYKSIGLKTALTQWATEYTPATFPAAVNSSVAANYAGLFPSKSNHQSAEKAKPMWQQIKELEARIDTHPGNWNWLKYNSKTATKEQKDEYRALLKQLEAMQAGQEPLPMGEGDIP
jgi:hypothetical protein